MFSRLYSPFTFGDLRDLYVVVTFRITVKVLQSGREIYSNITKARVYICFFVLICLQNPKCLLKTM